MFLVSSAQNVSGAGRTSYLMVKRAVSAEVKRPGHEADKSPLCSAETNNERTLTSTPNMPSGSAQSQFYWLFKIHRPQHFIMKVRRLPKLLPLSAAVMREGSVLSWLAHMEHSHHDLHAVRSSLSCYLCDPDRIDAGLSMHVDCGLCGKTLFPLWGLPAVYLTSCAPQESLAFYHPRLTSQIGSAGLRPNVPKHFVVHNALRLIPQAAKYPGRNSLQDNTADSQSVKYLTSWRFFIDVMCWNW
jgi:hypothetical protein